MLDLGDHRLKFSNWLFETANVHCRPPRNNSPNSRTREIPESFLFEVSEMNRLLLSYSFVFLLMLLFLASTSLSQDDDVRDMDCRPSSYTCGNITLDISYPFHFGDRRDNCGHPGYQITCEDNFFQIEIGSKMVYQVRRIDYRNQVIAVFDRYLMDDVCPIVRNTTLDLVLFGYTDHDRLACLYHNCSTPIEKPDLYPIPCLTTAGNYAYYTIPSDPTHIDSFDSCITREVAVYGKGLHRLERNETSLGNVLTDGFNVTWTVGRQICSPCFDYGGYCLPHIDSIQPPTCFCSNEQHEFSLCDVGKKGRSTPIIIGVATAGVVCFLACIILFCYYHRRRFGTIPSTLLSRDKSSEPSSKHDLEKSDSKFYGTHVFSYKELEEATDNFDESKELGDGGFGTVYYGKLRDGRSVAVKRLYENNYKRVEQFMNEVEILSRLRHRNLVSLYGCTSRHSRELLLVYEFVPNGTVADHLHGNHAQAGSLTWPIRLSIAIETAEALKYLHAVEPPIIHRDVKTNNILLDSNFHVKVADFGLSRLFPTDVTHVSTAPQGTPGYVDPDYHKCYQLTYKSDVYSFGVVLVELISSKPAVDITRHRHEINLAYMAISKIHNQTLHELVDPELGFESDYGVRKMITLVAELAFRCLQEEKEVRPSMEEVVEILKGVESGEYRTKKAEEVDHPSDHVGLLKDNPPLSPDTVMDSWVSRSTTPNTSG